jgi:hypothetical protein
MKSVSAHHVAIAAAFFGLAKSMTIMKMSPFMSCVATGAGCKRLDSIAARMKRGKIGSSLGSARHDILPHLKSHM